MGCSESKYDKEEGLSRFKHRIHFIKEAISGRNALFAALSSYAICLKNTGAAFTDGFHPHFSHHPSSPPQESVPSLPIPPPPPPLLPLKTPSLLTRTAIMPHIKPKSVVATIIEDDSDLETEELTRRRGDVRQSQLQLKEKKTIQGTSMHQGSAWDYFFEAEEIVEKNVKLPLSVPPVSMPESKPEPVVATIMEEESDFEAEELTRKEKAVQGTSMNQDSLWEYFFPGKDVVEEETVEKKKVKMPLRLRQPVVKKLIREKARSPQSVSLMEIFGDLDIHFLKAFESTLEVSQMLDYHSNFSHDQPNDYIEDIETLGTVLNKLLAWETKLYDEIKAREGIKYDYQKKMSVLTKQKKQGSNLKSLEKLKASISHLHTRYIVEVQSTVSTAAKINSIRDEQLYPKLVQLVDGMAMMWKSMLLQHESQLKIVYPLKSLDNPQPLNESSKYQYNCTIQLYGAVRGWHTQFCGLIEYQKDFVRGLHRWSELSLIPIETNLEEKMNSVMAENAPIHELLIAWKNDLDELPDEAARYVISNFAFMIRTIVHEQDKDLKLRETCQATPGEKKPAIISLKQRLEDNEEAHQTICKRGKDESLASLKHSLPDFFRALSETAQACSAMYHNLRNIAESQHKGEGEKNAAAPTSGGETKDDGKPISVTK
ncbi:hypothetical protein M5689_021401 [Euphorbia peplus]|nr:hypothetical protein M5689_021401 [Euphorbia peplus]